MAEVTEASASERKTDEEAASPPPSSVSYPNPSGAESPSSSSSSTPLPPSVARLWRPSAQRNLRNQWSKLASCRQQWTLSSSSGRSQATSLVNASLSQRYMPSMELGVLEDMPDIRKKACQKLFKQQELHGSKLVSSYRDMVAAVVNMITAMRSMRCYLKGGTSSPLVKFSTISEEKSDTGDGGGIPVFTFWSIPYFEKLAEELVEMFKSELCLKRLIVLELLSTGCEAPQLDHLNWSNALYSGEFNDLALCGLYSAETHDPLPPRLKGGKCDMPPVKRSSQASQETVQVMSIGFRYTE
ncbi:hypothetical protein CDL15_Pgr014681 [Punica granatum]|uniref:Uncharacterized protein n=1 Tax=Punica granatum TaxID=22663 RepID=A0A218Y0L5_PUNGR|nr:hypothetical protein CDL15_Pgr014681 [Punica granatum]